MTKRIFRSIFLVALIVLLSAMALTMTAVHGYFTRVQTEQLFQETALAAHGLEQQGLSFFEGMDNACRITWIDADGKVLYDNRLDSLDLPSHLQRQEVLSALETGFGQSVRYSDTLLERYIYTAQRMQDGTVLRLSTAQASVLRLVLNMAQPIALVLLITGLLTLLLSRRLSRSVVRPLNALNLDDPLSNTVYEEITPLLRRLSSQQAQLRGQSEELDRKQKQFETVTRSLSEGLVLLSSDGVILSINPAAANLLDVTRNCLGADFSAANRNETVASLVGKALLGEKAEETVALAGGIYLAAASPVRSEGTVFGVVLLLFDVTEKQRAEQLRREFTANVSHELKTPLHAISGCAELMKSGMVPPSDMPNFSKKIYEDAQRLIALVEDILRLSRLDEGAPDLAWSQVDLLSAAREARDRLQQTADAEGIRLTVEGTTAPIRAVPQLVSAIVFNLAENAVKYSLPGGSVTIRVEQTLVTVSDNGVGIPKEDQDRIFERFFRVDKSRSKAVGGTGLGLSIVKHAAAILDAKVTLDSSPGQGTTVTVAFQK